MSLREGFVQEFMFIACEDCGLVMEKIIPIYSIYFYLFIVYILICVLSVIYKIFTSGLEPQDKLSYFKEKLKYWTIGSLISLVAGFAVIFFMFFVGKYNGEIFNTFYNVRGYFYFFIILFGAFGGALSIKLIKRDFPWYFYSTVGIIYIIIFIYSFDYLSNFIIEIGDFRSINSDVIISAIEYNISISHTSLPLSEDYKLFLYAPIASLLGGGLVDLYRYLKKPKTGQDLL